MADRFCRNCHREVQAGVRVCPYCNASLNVLDNQDNNDAFEKAKKDSFGRRNLNTSLPARNKINREGAVIPRAVEPQPEEVKVVEAEVIDKNNTNNGNDSTVTPKNENTDDNTGCGCGCLIFLIIGLVASGAGPFGWFVLICLGIYALSKK